MKRSEMIEILENEINGRLYLEDHFYTDDISRILKVLETKGMNPPVYERGPNEMELQAGLEEGDRVFVTEWEPEDGN